MFVVAATDLRKPFGVDRDMAFFFEEAMAKEYADHLHSLGWSSHVFEKGADMQSRDIWVITEASGDGSPIAIFYDERDAQEYSEYLLTVGRVVLVHRDFEYSNDR